MTTDHPILAHVVWDDAQSTATESVSLKDIDHHHRSAVMQTVGWLLKEDEKGVSVANERCLDEGDETYRGHTFIPSSLVRSVTPVIKPKVSRKKKVDNVV